MFARASGTALLRWLSRLSLTISCGILLKFLKRFHKVRIIVATDEIIYAKFSKKAIYIFLPLICRDIFA